MLHCRDELDREPAVAPSSWPLVDEVAQFRVDHLTGEGGWLAHWPRFGEAPLPRAVRITLTLASGETIERWFALRG